MWEGVCGVYSLFYVDGVGLREKRNEEVNDELQTLSAVCRSLKLH